MYFSQRMELNRDFLKTRRNQRNSSSSKNSKSGDFALELVFLYLFSPNSRFCKNTEIFVFGRKVLMKPVSKTGAFNVLEGLSNNIGGNKTSRWFPGVLLNRRYESSASNQAQFCFFFGQMRPNQKISNLDSYTIFDNKLATVAQMRKSSEFSGEKENIVYSSQKIEW